MGKRGAEPRFFLSQDDPPSKQAVLRAALESFVQKGVAGTSIRTIGEAAGYTNPAMFKFFPSKDALVLHLFERCYRQLHGRVAAALAGKPFREALAAVVDAFLAIMDEDLEAVLFVQDGLRELWPRLSPALRKRSVIRDLRDLVDRGIGEGAVRGYASSDVPVAALLGLMAQLGRMLYFGEVEGPAGRHREELVLAVTRVMKG